MNDNFDLNLVPLRNQAGRDAPESMSFFVSEPARGCARGRSADRLALCLAMIGNSILSPGKQKQALEHLAKLYYKTPGSATTAMRVVVNELNSLLLKRNQHLSGTGKQGTALLAQLVMRGNQLYMALSGPLHLYVINASETRHAFEMDMEGKSVGQIRYPPIWLNQTTLHPNDTLILAVPPLPDWDDNTLRETRGQSPETVVRKLCSAPDGDMNAVLLQVKPGKGAFHIGLPESKSMPELGLSAVEPEDQPANLEAVTEPVGAPILLPENFETIASPAANVEVLTQNAVATKQEEISTKEIAAPVEAAPTEPVPPPAVPTKKNAGLISGIGRFFASTRVAAGAIGRPLATGARRVKAGMKSALSRILPEELFRGIPSSVMIFIAIAIPVIIVAVASQVYFSLGHEANNQALYAQALRQAEEAETQTDLLAKKAGWENALDTLESVDDNPEVKVLKDRAISALDSLHLVRRVDFREALEKNLPAEIKVTRLAVLGDDLYLLDGNSGNVIRAYQTSAGYVVDTTFTCGPSVQGATVSSPLIDIAAWPAGFKPNAEVLAIDSSWKILLCSKNANPEVLELAAPTNAAIGNLTGMTLDMDDLYVLDPSSNAVWIYWNNQMNSAPEEEPYPFFKDEIPVLSDVIDMVMSGDELHLLHSDGHLTVCVYSGIKEIPTRCSEPTFIDFRPGYENSPLVPLPLFSQIVYTPPPEPSLYFLESSSRAIYKFSVRSLGFQVKFLPAGEPDSGEATAFAVDQIRRIIYLAIGNEVYSAPIP